ncbi:hypothetical protein ACH4FX_05110 [Streptomyces sp. NPDC018019]|uniref:hypothetical protein n=1 Tax=Streptomyces sp. NPDC018019 TaxID=3365030 RepID=UPI0037934E9C
MSIQLPRPRGTFRLAATAAVTVLAVLAPAAGALAAEAPHPPAAGAGSVARAQGGGEYVRSVELPDGVSVGKIYKLGDHHYREEGFADGASFGSIEARPDRPYAAGNLNGMFTVLDNNGNVVSWIQRTSQGHGAHTEKLADGETVAKVTALGEQRHKAEFSRDGRVLGTMEADTDTLYGVFRIGSVWAVLDLDGGVASYVGPADIDACTVTKTIDSVLPAEGMTVELTNRPVPKSGPNGPQAALKDKYGVVVGRVNFNHPELAELGLKMTDVLSGRPTLTDRRPAGGAWRTTAFPKLPKGCAKTA